SEEKRKELGIKPLPSTLHNAIKAFKADKLIQEALGEHLTKSFIDSKELEWARYTQSVSEWERQRYINY
ncbi:MAG: glutamine synthetase, partial [Lactobacillus iners]|nr:glutamine synthetase [Lactobacillus iners]